MTEAVDLIGWLALVGGLLAVVAAAAWLVAQRAGRTAQVPQPAESVPDAASPTGTGPEPPPDTAATVQLATPDTTEPPHSTPEPAPDAAVTVQLATPDTTATVRWVAPDTTVIHRCISGLARQSTEQPADGPASALREAAATDQAPAA